MENVLLLLLFIPVVIVVIVVIAPRQSRRRGYADVRWRWWRNLRQVIVTSPELGLQLSLTGIETCKARIYVISHIANHLDHLLFGSNVGMFRFSVNCLWCGAAPYLHLRWQIAETKQKNNEVTATAATISTPLSSSRIIAIPEIKIHIHHIVIVVAFTLFTKINKSITHKLKRILFH